MEHKTPGIIDLGAGLKLHPVSTDDAGELYAAIERNRAHLRQWLPWVSDSYAFHEALRFLEEKVRENHAGEALTMTMRLEGVLCGAIGLHRIDHPNRASSIGYWVDAGYSGRGIVTRACQAIVDLGFRHYDLHRIEIRCATGNEKSAAIAQRLGFVEEGTLREAEWLYDHWVDLRVFGALKHGASKKVPG
jgi:ribosomal-protein-serine acetyltransferase